MYINYHHPWIGSIIAMEEETTSTLMTLLPLNVPLLSLIIVNFVIATLLLACIKYVHAAVTHVRADEELSVRDNPAFAISMSGVVLGVIILMTGVMSSEASLDLKLQSFMIAGYGVLGIVLLSVSR